MITFPTFKRIQLILLSAFVFLGLCFVPCIAAQPRTVKSPFKVGDKVKFTWAGTILEGEVFTVDPRNGWVTVSFDDNGKERTLKLPPDSFQPITKKATPSGSPKKTDQSSATKKSEMNGEMRTWTDVSGKFKTEAQFVDLVDGNVQLKKSDGKITTLPLKKLSEADRTLAKQLAENSNGENPFASDEEDVTSDHKTPSQNELAKGDWSQVKNITVDVTANNTITPDALINEKLPRLQPIILKQPKTQAASDVIFLQVADLIPDRGHQRIFIVYVNRDPRGSPGPQLECCDLKTAKSLWSVTLASQCVPVDLSPDGSLVVCAPSIENIRNKTTSVEIWRADKKGSCVKRWDVSEPEAKPLPISSFDAFFVTSDKILSINKWGNKLTLWDINNTQAVYTIQTIFNSSLALSANRKQLALPTSSGIGILDAATGDTLAFLPSDPLQNMIMSFRPDGRQLAGFSGDRLRIWDLEKKEMIQDVGFSLQTTPNVNMHPERLDWINDDYLLVNGSTLINIPKQVVLWEYRLPRAGRTAMLDGMLCYVLTQQQGMGRSMSGLFFSALPHPQAQQVLSELSTDKLLAIKPGIQVALDVRFTTSNPDELKQATDALTEKLKANGMTVAPSGAAITLEATTEAGKTDTKTYKKMGSFETETVSVTQQINKLSFKENGRTLWEKASVFGGSAPIMVNLKEGESIQSAVNNQNQSSPVWFFTHTPLPKNVIRQSDKGAYGTSILTPNGPAPLEGN